MSTFHLKVDQKDSIAVYFKEGDLKNILINNKNTRTSELGAGVSLASPFINIMTDLLPLFHFPAPSPNNLIPLIFKKLFCTEGDKLAHCDCASS